MALMILISKEKNTKKKVGNKNWKQWEKLH